MRKGVIILLVVVFIAFVFSAMGAYLIAKHKEIAFGEKVAVIPLRGTIALSQDSGIFAEERATPKKIKDQLKKAERDSSVKAVVIEIDSPGGSVVAAEEIADAIEEFPKPTVAWLGEMATSGAYYVATSADYIVADQASLTGSIGVISIFPEYSKLLEKLGVNMTVIKAGEFKDFSSGFRPMTEEEKEMMEEVIFEVYEQFLDRVAVNRNLSDDYVRSVAEGKIYTGVKAKELRLVDEVGNRDKAIDIASHMGGIKGKPQVVTYRKVGFLEEFIGTAFANFGYGFAKGLVESQTMKY